MNVSRLACISGVMAGPLTQPTLVSAGSVRLSQSAGSQSHDCCQVPPETACAVAR